MKIPKEQKSWVFWDLDCPEAKSGIFISRGLVPKHEYPRQAPDGFYGHSEPYFKHRSADGWHESYKTCSHGRWCRKDAPQPPAATENGRDG